MAEKSTHATTPRRPILVLFHSGLIGTPFFHTPHGILAYKFAVFFEVVDVLSGTSIMQYGVDVSSADPLGQAINCLVQFDAWLAEESKNPDQNIHLFSVHSRSVVARLYGRWAELRGISFQVPGNSLTWHDVCELINYPAILSLEERSGLTPATLQMIMGKTDTSVVNTVCQMIRRFQ